MVVASSDHRGPVECLLRLLQVGHSGMTDAGPAQSQSEFPNHGAILPPSLYLWPAYGAKVTCQPKVSGVTFPSASRIAALPPLGPATITPSIHVSVSQLAPITSIP